MGTLIIVSRLGIWSMKKGHGGPAFYNTVKKYKDEKWDVVLISDEKDNISYSADVGIENIFVEPSVFKKYIRIRKIGLFFRVVDHLITNRRYKREIKRVINSRHEKDILLYAYEIFGVRACKAVSKEYSIPLITRFQGTILSEYKKNLYNFISRYPHFQALSEEASLIIMTDDGTKGLQVLRDLGNSSKVLFLKNGLDLLDRDVNSMMDDFDRERFLELNGIREVDQCVFLTVSRLVPWKKVDRALDAFKGYLDRESLGTLIIVGDGVSKPGLEKRAMELGIMNHVVFTGAVSHEDVYKYMMACDVFLSLYDLSNVGNPLLEAMTLGKCIVTLNVGDTGLIVHDNENGILLQPEELEQLPDVLSKLSNSKVFRDKLALSAKQFAQKSFYGWRKRMQIEYDEICKIINA